MAITESVPETQEDASCGDDMLHYACVDKLPLVSFCGLRLDDHEQVYDGEVDCVVCHDLGQVKFFCPHGTCDCSEGE